jgi:hypothetical protein
MVTYLQGAAFGYPLFRISVYDKDRVFQCQIGDPSALEATVRHNQVSTLTMTVPLSHRRVPELMADGARVVVLFRGEHLISGPVTADALDTDDKKGTYTISVEDDFRVLKEVLGWQVPGSAIGSQGSAEYRRYTGTAENIVKLAVTENGITRLGISGLTCAPNLGRGATIPGGLSYRMHPLMDLLFPAVETAGLGVTVQQAGTDLLLDVYEPTTFANPLSVKGGTLKRVGMTRTRPTASRAVVGGSGEGKARYFRNLTDTTRETAYGVRAEVFVDDRQAGSDYLGLVKDVADANTELKEATGEYNKADRAHDQAVQAQEAADAAFTLAQETGSTTASTKAQTALNTANTKVTARLADLTAATTEKTTKQTAYNTLNGQLAASLTAYQTAMDESGTKALTEAGPTNGVSITLAGAGIFTYGPGGFHVGDRVPIEVVPGTVLTEVIRECTLKWVSPQHTSVDPIVGERTDQPQRKAAQLFAALGRRLRNQETR